MRILHWKTLFGRRLLGDALVPWMLGGVVLFSLLPSIFGAFFDVGLDSFDRMAQALDVSTAAIEVVVHTLLGWTTAFVVLVIAGFTLAHCRTERPPEVILLAASLPAVALLEILHVRSWWLLEPGEADQARLWSWFLARTGLAALLTLGAGLAVLTPERPRQARLLAGGCLVLGAVFLALATIDPAAAPPMLHQDAFLARPWDLLPLALFAVGGLFVFPQLHRQRPSVLSHALMLSMLPQIVAQLEAAFGSILPVDGHAMIAHLGALLAAVTVLCGILFDYVATQRGRADAMTGYESARIKLRSKTQELVRADRELVDQDILRRRAERSLRILEKAVQTMSLGVTVADLEGRILYVNPADARMHGYSVDELLGKNAQLYSSPSKETDGDSDSIYLQPWSRERTNVTRDGRTFPVRLVSDIVRDDNDQPIAMVTLCEDISERKRIELALERRDRILEAVSLAAERFLADASWEESVEEVIDSLERATGVDRVNLARVTELKPPEPEDTWIVVDPSHDTAPLTVELPTVEIFPRWERELRQGRLIQGRVNDLPETERRDLEARGVRSFAVVPIFVVDDWLGFLSLEDGDASREWSPAELEVLRAAARTFGAAMHRKRSEAALATSQSKYQDLLENASDLIQSLSPAGRFQYVNRSWRDTLGYAQEEVGELSVWDVVHPEHHEICRDALAKIGVGEPVDRLELIFVTKENEEIYVEGSLNGRFHGQELQATRAIFRDITERKIIDRMKSEFISTVSHELRTPLTSIIASLGLLQSGQLDGDAKRTNELIAVAHRNSNRLLQLINDLLDLRMLAAGKVSYQRHSVEIASLLDEALRGIEDYASSLKIELELDEIDPELHVVADRNRLIQVLNNLLSNAIKFSPKGEKVLVSAHRSEGWGVITVADHGQGIPEDFQHRLFERFTQFDASATRSTGGSGLGLSIVKGLVEGMEGRVRVETEMGEGTSFYVDLPLTEPEPPRRRRASSSRPEPSRRT